MNKFLQFLGIKHKLSREAFEAYFNRLPDNIQVSWFRSGKFIVGDVVAGEKKFMTQGMDADDFIDMVNDGVVMMNNVPQEYSEIIHKMLTYMPPVEEMAKLQNKDIQQAVISAHKNKEVLQVMA